MDGSLTLFALMYISIFVTFVYRLCYFVFCLELYAITTDPIRISHELPRQWQLNALLSWVAACDVIAGIAHLWLPASLSWDTSACWGVP